MRLIKYLIPAFFLILTISFTSLYLNSIFKEKPKTQENLLVQTQEIDGFYQNSVLNYSLTYPEAWFLGFNGPSFQAASEVWFVSSVNDINLANGGLPEEVKVKINVHSLKNLTKTDPQFKKISSTQDWLDWQRNNNSSSDFKDEAINFNNIQAIKTTYNQPALKNFGPGITITFLNPEKTHIFQINYLGKTQTYYTFLDDFDKIIKSFKFI